MKFYFYKMERSSALGNSFGLSLAGALEQVASPLSFHIREEVATVPLPGVRVNVAMRLEHSRCP